MAAAAIAGATGVLIGAFAAHGLRASLDAKALEWIDTGVRYQMIHAVALLALGALSAFHRSRLMIWTGALWAVGILLFAGSLYILALTGWRPIVFVTPLGGTAFVAGWVLLLVVACRGGTGTNRR
ncbi:MAG: DUF423 domain-containing protein [Pseudomonadota bacterium]